MYVGFIEAALCGGEMSNPFPLLGGITLPKHFICKIYDNYRVSVYLCFWYMPLSLGTPYSSRHPTSWVCSINQSISEINLIHCFNWYLQNFDIQFFLKKKETLCVS